MSDDDVRALFHRIDDGPPLGIDAREVMAHGRRVRTLRTRLTIAGSALTVAAAAVVGGLVLGGGAPSPAPDMERPATPPSTTSTPHVPVPAPQTTPSPNNNPVVPELNPPTGNGTAPGANPPGANPPGNGSAADPNTSPASVATTS